MYSKKKPNIFQCVCDKYNIDNRVKLYSASRDSLDLVQRMGLLKVLPIHRGCVNTLCWNERGDHLLSGSDDQQLIVTHGHNYKVLSTYRTSHRANIFSAKFMPNSGDNHIVSCSGDGIVLYTDLNRPGETFYNQFLCHTGTTYEVVTIPNDPNNFISCGEDGTVRNFDLRIKTKCKKLRCTDNIMITCRRAVTALCINQNAPYEIAVGCSDGKVRTFDRRCLGTFASGWLEKEEALKPISCFMAPNLDQEIYRITSLNYSPDGQDILVSYSSDYLYLFSLKDPNAKRLSTACSPETNLNEAGNGNGRKVRKLRLRGDWSDTGPDARPEREAINDNRIGQARPQLQATLMQRMTDVLTRMLNDPQTRAALSGGGENSLDTTRNSRRRTNPETSPNNAENPGSPSNNTENPGSPPNNTENPSTPPNNTENPGIPLNNIENPSTPPNNTENPGSPLNNAENPSSPPNNTENPSTPPNNTENPGTSPNNAENPDSHPNNPENPGSPLNNTENPGTLPNNIENPGTPPNNTENPGTPPSNVGNPGTPTNNAENPEIPVTIAIQAESSIETQDGPSPMVEGSVETGKEASIAPINSVDASMEVIDESETQNNIGELQTSVRSDNVDNIPSMSDELLNQFDDSASTSSQRIVNNSFSVNKIENIDTRSFPSTSNTVNRLSSLSISSDVNDRLTNSSAVIAVNDMETESSNDIAPENSSSENSEDMVVDQNASTSARRTTERNRNDEYEDGDVFYSDSEEEHPEYNLDNLGHIGHEFAAVVGSNNSGRETFFDETETLIPEAKRKFTGHRNARTMIKEATFYGDQFIMSGSDCGHIFVWDRYTAQIVMLLQGDQHVVNCIQPHPTLPIMATSGIDYDVKIWAPVREEPTFDREMVAELTKRNEIMLEETRDTVTVPAAFMIRMLACLNQIRRGGPRSPRFRRHSHDTDMGI